MRHAETKLCGEHVLHCATSGRSALPSRRAIACTVAIISAKVILLRCSQSLVAVGSPCQSCFYFHSDIMDGTMSALARHGKTETILSYED